MTQKLPNDVKIITEGSGADTKYYAQLGADAASKKLLGSANGNLTIKYRFVVTMNTGESNPGSGSITVVLENGEIKSHTITGSGWSTTVGGVSKANSCSVGSFSITSITWTPS